MSFYDYFFDFFRSLIGNGNLDQYTFTLMGVNSNMADYLAHGITIVCIGLVAFLLIKLTIWLFKMFGGLFKW